MNNPYASCLGHQKPLDVLAGTSKNLQSLLDKIGPQRIANPSAPGKWSARDILCHLADCEVVFAFRLRQTLAQPHHVIQPFDQDEWARMYQAYEATAALAVFSALRTWNLALIHAVPAAEFSRPVTHPERGQMTFRTVVETMAGHDINHVRQVESIAERKQPSTK